VLQVEEGNPPPQFLAARSSGLPEDCGRETPSACEVGAHLAVATIRSANFICAPPTYLRNPAAKLPIFEAMSSA
jgi:hypothetical protein